MVNAGLKEMDRRALSAHCSGRFAVNAGWIEQLVSIDRHQLSASALTLYRRPIETRAPTGVARRAAFLLHAEPHGILIAVDPQFDHALYMSRAFALAP